MWSNMFPKHSRVLIGAGKEDNDVQRTMHVYDWSDRTWTQAEDLPVGLWGIQCAFYKGKDQSHDMVGAYIHIYFIIRKCRNR